MRKSKTSVTMKEVAALAGVSVGTVSRVVNGELGVKPATLKKVQDAVAALNYIPDVYARGMKMNRTETVALIVPTVWHPFFSEFAYHVETALAQQNYKLLLCNIEGPKKELEYITMLQQNKVDGIIAITYSPIDEYLASDIPFVSIDRTYSDKAISCVTSDNKHGAELAAQTLIDKGCRHFAFVGGHNDTMNETKHRRRYFEKYLSQQGYDCLVFDLEEPYDDFKGPLAVFLQEHPEIDGIFAINDFTALDTVAVLKAQGRRVPEDVQIIGYDGIRMAPERPHPVSTIRQPIPDMAAAAVALLLDILKNRAHELQIVLPVTYVDGSTTQ